MSEQLNDQISPDWVSRYLALLNQPRKAPSRDALTDLIRANFGVVVFENVTSLQRRLAHPDRPVPAIDAEMLLANWEARRGGGVCYEISGMFHRLLVALGYEATLLLAQISFPGGHQAIQVTLAGKRYLVDAGTGAPMFEPIPLKGPVEIHRAGLAYRIRAGDEPGTWVTDRWIDDAWSAFTRFTLPPLDRQLQSEAYQRHHTFGESWVVDRLRMVRCTEETLWSVTGNELTTFDTAGKRVTVLHNLAEYEEMAADLFHLPNLPLVETARARPQFLNL